MSDYTDITSVIVSPNNDPKKLNRDVKKIPSDYMMWRLKQFGELQTVILMSLITSNSTITASVIMTLCVFSIFF